MVAIPIEQGRWFGNWLRTKSLDEELFNTIGDVESDVIKRSCVINPTTMASKWPKQQFIYEGNVLRIPEEATTQDTLQSFSQFTWAMVAIVSALDVCMSPMTISNFMVDFLVNILVGTPDERLRDSLKIQLPANIEAWRSAGIVRKMGTCADVMRRSRESLVNAQAIPQLNRAEQKEMKDFLTWVLAENTVDIQVVSATVFAVAEWLRSAGLHIRTKGKRKYEAEPFVRFEKGPQSFGGFLDSNGPNDSSDIRRGLENRI